MVLVGHAETWKAPGVFEAGVEGEVVAFDGERGAMTEDLQGARVIVRQRVFEPFAPARSAGGQGAGSKSYGRPIEARVESSSTVESNLLGIQLVKVVQEAADREALVIVEGMLEDARAGRVAVEHQIFANDAAGIGEAIGELLVGGEQKQTWSFGAVGADDHGLSSLQMRVALLVEVDGAGDTAVAVQFDAMDVGVRADFAAPGFLCHANRGGEGTGFCAHFAAERLAEAAVDTGAASGARLRKNGHGRRERVPAEFARGALENYAGAFHRERGHGIGLGARRVEGAGAGEAGDSDFPINFRVIGL